MYFSVDPMQSGVTLIGDYKFSIGLNVSVDGCLSLYINPAMNWRLVQGVPCLCPKMLRWAPTLPPLRPLTG